MAQNPEFDESFSDKEIELTDKIMEASARKKKLNGEEILKKALR